MAIISAAKLTDRESKLFAELELREKKELEELKSLIGQARQIEQDLQKRYKALAGVYCQ